MELRAAGALSPMDQGGRALAAHPPHLTPLARRSTSMAAMAPSSRRHALSRAAVVLLVSTTGSSGCGHAQHQAPVIPWTGCSAAPRPPSGLLEPPTPIGSIDATSRWRAISSVGAPSAFPNQSYWTARGVVLLDPMSGGGAVYDPYKDAWRAVPKILEQSVPIRPPAFVSGDGIVFTGFPPPRLFDVEHAAWRSIPPPPEGIGTASARAWTGSTLFLWGGVKGSSFPASHGSPEEDSALGGVLDVAKGTWRPVARDGAPTARSNPMAVWTGSVFFVWGGTSKEGGSGRQCDHGHVGIESGCVYHTDGAIYDPLQDRWHSVPAIAGGSAREGGPVDGAAPLLVQPEILWTGRVVLLWEPGSTSTVMYVYDPFACRWRAPLVTPASLGRDAGMSAGRAVFLSPGDSYMLDVDQGTFSRITPPEEIRGCWNDNQLMRFEPSRVIALAPALCNQGTLAVSAFDPGKNTWKTAVLPPVPIPATIPGARGPFNGSLVWTGEHLVAWGGSYLTADHWSTGCENAPRGMACDPVGGPPMQESSEGYIIKPSL